MNRFAPDSKPEVCRSELERDSSRLAATVSRRTHIEPLGRSVGYRIDMLQRGAHHRALPAHPTGMGIRSTSL